MAADPPEPHLHQVYEGNHQEPDRERRPRGGGDDSRAQCRQVDPGGGGGISGGGTPAGHGLLEAKGYDAGEKEASEGDDVAGDKMFNCANSSAAPVCRCWC